MARFARDNRVMHTRALSGTLPARGAGVVIRSYRLDGDRYTVRLDDVPEPVEAH